VTPAPALSVILPAHQEAASLRANLERASAALRAEDVEIVVVDDGSTDGSAACLASIAERDPLLRVVRHRRCAGQSAALRSGIRVARHAWIATLDGDGQNDPADIAALLDVLRAPASAPAPALLAGWRTTRHDSGLRKLSSRVANGVRGRLLGDGTPDTGCGLKLFPRETFLGLPAFDHMHRFLPALFQREGLRVLSVPVRHRPRRAGRSKYGVHNRLWVGIVDLLGVMWLRRRALRPEVET
jgi:dolichol-phosphate mannosyltransferase